MSAEALDERRLARLIEVGRVLVAELDLEVVLHRVLETARELSGARYAAIGILDAEGHELERFIALGIDDRTRTEIGELPRGRGVLGLLIDDPRPLRLEDVGRHPRSYGFPPGHPRMRSFLGVPVTVRGEAFGNLYLTEKRDGPFDEADEQTVVTLAGWAGIAIDNARLYGETERGRAELARAVRSLEATTEVARAVGGETDLEHVLEMIAKRARALIDARSVVVLLEEQDGLVVVATAGEVAEDVRGRRISLEDSASDRALRALHAERIADLSTQLHVPILDLGIDARAAMFVRLASQGRPLGLIGAFDRLTDGPEFDDEDVHLLNSFAGSAATAIATAKSVGEDRLRSRIEASERERGRWARELHDETLQALGAMRMGLSSALRSRGEALERVARDTVAQLGEEIDKIRALITELRPATLDQVGLKAAIEALVLHVERTQGLEVRSEIEIGDGGGRAPELDPELESTVYRVVQEALTNVSKHARAELVGVRVIEAGSSIEIEITDDGVGFDPTERTEGFGLAGMRERVELAGGRIEITSARGTGTTISVTLPAVGEASGQRGAA